MATNATTVPVPGTTAEKEDATDFIGSLATATAPLLILFGELATKQFLSLSMGCRYNIGNRAVYARSNPCRVNVLIKMNRGGRCPPRNRTYWHYDHCGQCYTHQRVSPAESSYREVNVSSTAPDDPNLTSTRSEREKVLQMPSRSSYHQRPTRSASYGVATKSSD